MEPERVGVSPSTKVGGLALPLSVRGEEIMEILGEIKVYKDDRKNRELDRRLDGGGFP